MLITMYCSTPYFSLGNQRNAWTFLKPVLTYVCEQWLTKGDKGKIAYFERSVLIRIFGPILENKVYKRIIDKYN